MKDLGKITKVKVRNARGEFEFSSDVTITFCFGERAVEVDIPKGADELFVEAVFAAVVERFKEPL